MTSGILVQEGSAGDSSAATLTSVPAPHLVHPPLIGETAHRHSLRARSDHPGPDALERGSEQVTRAERLAGQDPREVARAMLPTFGFADSEFACLDSLYVSESGWDPLADNPTSSAYGIPQALTETHRLPADYMTNPVSQIRWGLGYIRNAYGTPCAAWAFKRPTTGTDPGRVAECVSVSFDRYDGRENAQPRTCVSWRPPGREQHVGPRSHVVGVHLGGDNPHARARLLAARSATRPGTASDFTDNRSRP